MGQIYLKSPPHFDPPPAQICSCNLNIFKTVCPIRATPNLGTFSLTRTRTIFGTMTENSWMSEYVSLCLRSVVNYSWTGVLKACVAGCKGSGSNRRTKRTACKPCTFVWRDPGFTDSYRCAWMRTVDCGMSRDGRVSYTAVSSLAVGSVERSP